MASAASSGVVTHPVACDLAGTVAPQQLSVGTHNRVVVKRPVIHRPRQTPLPCRTGAALCLPHAESGRHFAAFVLTAVERALTLDDPVLFVVGHCSRDEPPDLGAARVKGVKAVIDDDRVGWVDLATSAGTLAEIHGYLGHLTLRRGWSCAPQGMQGRSVADDVEAFQAEYNQRFDASILVDGVCGKETLGAIFDVLRGEWTTWLDDRRLGPPELAKANVNYVGGADLDRTVPRVAALGPGGGLDALIVQASALPDVDVRIPYDSAIARDETFEVHWHFVHDDLRVRLWIADGPNDALPHALVLAEDSGLFSSTKLLETATRFDDGTVEVVFTDVPSRGTYTMWLLATADAPREVMLAKAPYHTLFDDRRPPEDQP